MFRELFCLGLFAIGHKTQSTLFSQGKQVFNVPCCVSFVLTCVDLTGLCEQITGWCLRQRKQTGPISMCCCLSSWEAGTSCMSTIGSCWLSWVWKIKRDWCQLPSWIWVVTNGKKMKEIKILYVFMRCTRKTQRHSCWIFVSVFTLHSSCSTCGSSGVPFSNVCLFQPWKRILLFSLCVVPTKLRAALFRQWSVMLWLASLLSKWRNFIWTFPTSKTICWEGKHRFVISDMLKTSTYTKRRITAATNRKSFRFQRANSCSVWYHLPAAARRLQQNKLRGVWTTSPGRVHQQFPVLHN